MAESIISLTKLFHKQTCKNFWELGHSNSAELSGLHITAEEWEHQFFHRAEWREFESIQLIQRIS